MPRCQPVQNQAFFFLNSSNTGALLIWVFPPTAAISIIYVSTAWFMSVLHSLRSPPPFIYFAWCEHIIATLQCFSVTNVFPLFFRMRFRPVWHQNNTFELNDVRISISYPSFSCWQERVLMIQHVVMSQAPDLCARGKHGGEKGIETEMVR